MDTFNFISTAIPSTMLYRRRVEWTNVEGNIHSSIKSGKFCYVKRFMLQKIKARWVKNNYLYEWALQTWMPQWSKFSCATCSGSIFVSVRKCLISRNISALDSYNSLVNILVIVFDHRKKCKVNKAYFLVLILFWEMPLWIFTHKLYSIFSEVKT